MLPYIFRMIVIRLLHVDDAMLPVLGSAAVTMHLPTFERLVLFLDQLLQEDRHSEQKRRAAVSLLQSVLC